MKQHFFCNLCGFYGLEIVKGPGHVTSL